MPELTKKFFEKILRESEKNDELQVTKVKVSDENEFGKHFCSQVNSLEVHVKTKDEMKIIQLVIKSQPPETARKFLTASRTFEREVEMYSLVLPHMARYVVSGATCGPDTCDVLPIPRCYFSRCEGGEQTRDDMVILENILQQGFIFIENGDVLANKAHVEIVMREIAKFHAISYCMKVKSLSGPALLTFLPDRTELTGASRRNMGPWRMTPSTRRRRMSTPGRQSLPSWPVWRS